MALKRQIAGFNGEQQPRYDGTAGSGRLGKVDSATVDAWLEPYLGDPVAYGTDTPTGDPAIVYPIRPVQTVPEEGSVLNTGAPGAPYMNVPRNDIPQDTTPTGRVDPPILSDVANTSPVPNGPVPDDAGAAGSGNGGNSWLWLLALGMGGYMLYKNNALGSVGKQRKNKWLVPAAIVGGVGLLYLYSKKKDSTGTGGGVVDPGDGPGDGGGGVDTPAELFPPAEVVASINDHILMFAASNISFVRRALIGYASNEVIDSMGSGEITALYKYITEYVIQQAKPLTRDDNPSLYAEIVQIKKTYGIPLF